MQRTVRGTKINYKEFENGIFLDKSTVVEINDTAKAIKKFKRTHDNCVVVSTEDVATTYYLDDEIFFKYAYTKDEG